MTTEPYFADDRGDRVDFTYTESGDSAATLWRESGKTADQLAWDGGPDVTAWAVAHGYEEVLEATRYD